MATTLNPLPSLIRASAHDAAAMSMRSAGRAKWNEDDWNTMAETQERLIRSCYGREANHNEPNRCYIRFSVAEQMERDGRFTLRSDVKAVMAEIDAVLT